MMGDFNSYKTGYAQAIGATSDKLTELLKKYDRHENFAEHVMNDLVIYLHQELSDVHNVKEEDLDLHNIDEIIEQIIEEAFGDEEEGWSGDMLDDEGRPNLRVIRINHKKEDK